MRYPILYVFLISLFSHNFSIISQTSPLKLDEIMSGKDFTGYWPENHSWLPNGQIYFKWNPENKMKSDFYVVKDDLPIKMEYKNVSFIPSWNMQKHISNKFYVFTKNGRLLKWLKGEKEPEILYESYNNIRTPQLVSNPDIIYFLKDATLCKIDLKNTFYKEVLSFSKIDLKKKKTDQELYLENQQLELFNFHKKVKLKKEYEQDLENKISSWKRKPVVIDGVDDIFISPNENFVIYIQVNNKTNKSTHVENYNDASGWSSIKRARPKVGRLDRTEKLFIYNFKNDSSIFVNIDHLTGIFNRPIYLKEYEKKNFKEKSEEIKLLTYHRPIFNKIGDKAIIEIRSLDNKDRWITILNLTTGIIKEIDYQHEDTWIGGPGISGWNSAQGAVGWIDNDQSIWFQSEETGYSHLYKKSISKLKKTTLTSGNFEVRSVQLSNDEETFYLTLNKSNPANRGFYHLRHQSKELIPILVKEGNYKVKVSPNEKEITFLYSSSNQPWELFHSLNEPNAVIKKITSSTTNSFDSYNWRKPPLVSFKGNDGVDVPARLYKPLNEVSNGAGIIFVHGAGYLQNAHNWWSSYYREYMFHNLLCDLGFTVLDIDYRGSEGYGRDWRTAIYRHMGGWDLNDQLSGRDFLINQLAVDSTKIGIYGGSYGGFITIMALLTHPGKFKSGAALRSVTDWAHYNHEYTSNILNTPVLDSTSFRKSSPIYFAENLEDNLLVLHGVMDDNVQYQDVVRLSQRFIELKKENWELALYPVEPHGFKQPSSWYDEYRRILKIFLETLP